MVDTDAALVMRARHGDDLAFSQLVRRHHASVHRAACLIMRCAMEAEDIAQDAWLHAYVHLGQFHDAASFKTWLHAIVRNCAINHYRRARTRRRYDATQLTTLPVYADVRSDAETPEELVINAERRERLAAAIAALPPRLRSTLELLHTDQYSYEEMSRMTGVRTGTIKSRVWEARQHLTKAFASTL